MHPRSATIRAMSRRSADRGDPAGRRQSRFGHRAPSAGRASSASSTSATGIMSRATPASSPSTCRARPTRRCSTSASTRPAMSSASTAPASSWSRQYRADAAAGDADPGPQPQPVRGTVRQYRRRRPGRPARDTAHPPISTIRNLGRWLTLRHKPIYDPPRRPRQHRQRHQVGRGRRHRRDLDRLLHARPASARSPRRRPARAATWPRCWPIAARA